MGGRGARSSGSGSGGTGGVGIGGPGTFSVDSLSFPGGPIEFDGVLQYGPKDAALTGTARSAVEAWEDKRVKNKVEYAYAVDANGTPVGKEIRGSKGSVAVPRYYHTTQDSAFTHIHPREDGGLGGTFSDADLRNFANFNNKTFRAAAKEGTYSISKTSSFDAQGFKGYVARSHSAFENKYNSTQRGLNSKLRNGVLDYTTYASESQKGVQYGACGTSQRIHSRSETIWIHVHAGAEIRREYAEDGT